MVPPRSSQEAYVHFIKRCQLQVNSENKEFLGRVEMLYETQMGEMDKLGEHYLTRKRCSWLCQIIFFLLSHTEQERELNHNKKCK